MHNEIRLEAGERLDNLQTENGLHIIQSKEVFSFSLDAVLLSRFATIPRRGKIMDLCSGNGVIPLLLSTRTEASIDAVELQPRLADMARRSVQLNGLEQRIRVLTHDLREIADIAGNGEYDAVTVNPPYMAVRAGDQNESSHYAIARHELHCTIEDVARATARVLRPGGKMAMVHRPARLPDIIEALRQFRLEPKRIQLVHPHTEAEANMILIEAIRDGGPEVRMLPPLFVYEKGVQII